MALIHDAQAALQALEHCKVLMAMSPPIEMISRRQREKDLATLNEDIHTLKLFMSMIPKYENILTKVRTSK